MRLMNVTKNMTSGAHVLKQLNSSSLNNDELVRLFESIAFVDITNVTSEYFHVIPSVKVFFYTLYILIFITGILGNALVCYVVISNRSMQTVTNLFILNLALSDILLCTFSVPFTPLYLLTFGSWVFGKLFCHLLPYVQGVSVYISAFTLTAIAGDRFMAIIYPFKPRVSISVCFIIIAVIWIEALLLTIPFGWFMEQTYEQHIVYCDEVWPSEQFRKSFIVSTTILQFIVPFALITYCYIKIFYKLRQRTQRKLCLKSARKKELEREKTKRTNRMLISMVLIFGASWLPLNLYNLIQDFYTPASGWSHGRILFLLTHSIAMSSTCYNPFLYAWLNETFRKEFKRVLPCFHLSTDECSIDQATGSRRHQLTSQVDATGETTWRQRSALLRSNQLEDNCNAIETNANVHEMIQLQEQTTCVRVSVTNDASVIVNTKSIDIDDDDDGARFECNQSDVRSKCTESDARVLKNSFVPDFKSNFSSVSISANNCGDKSSKVVHEISNSCLF